MKIHELYDQVAESYESLLNSSEFDVQLMNNLKKVFSKYKITKGSILDLGCGPGNLKTALGDNFSYTGIDVSEKMLLKAKGKGYITIHGRIEDCLRQIPDKAFDYVVSVSALHFTKDINFIISELDRISKRGWLISLANITESYIKNFPITEPMYNHTKIIIPNVQEDILFDAWTSPLTGEKIKERMIFRKF